MNAKRAAGADPRRAAAPLACLAFAATAACAGPPAEPLGVTLAPGRADAKDPCPPLVARERARAVAGIAEAARQIDARTEPPAAPPFLGACLRDARGVWLVTLEWARPDPTWHDWIAVRWALARVEGDAQRGAVVPGSRDDDLSARPDTPNFYLGRSQFSKGSVVAFDYDGDGAAEVVTLVTTHVGDEAVWSRGRVWTFRDGAARLYPEASAFDVEGARDIDHDGRPDLVTYAGRTGMVESCDGGTTYRVTGPELVAHSARDGSFTWADPSALAAARAACPSRPERLATDEQGDMRSIARNVVCARLWGATAEEVARALVVACGVERPGCDAACTDRALLDQWAKAAAPLRLR